MPTYLARLRSIALICVAVWAASGSIADSALTPQFLVDSAAAAERIYLAAGTTDSDEQATIGDPDEKAAIGDPGEKANIGDPDEQANVADPGEKARIEDPDEEATIGDPDEKSKF